MAALCWLPWGPRGQGALVGVVQAGAALAEVSGVVPGAEKVLIGAGVGWSVGVASAVGWGYGAGPAGLSSGVA